ncbi:carboxymuconolactone decarboxylase family protein [Gimibacter soli]|uniref:Carboxymuconolactone decarboxylase family protein n=1 Tax=Gimibacter soli TaxID=3024400 RepID=A0AAE9XR69_9PROT|nr:carboxymuconolactone decarboxylase family protein [Gimibacter soli]WCL54727.1 carboxymuconolactone decarboxylase family protein [Gimibacter soli]
MSARLNYFALSGSTAKGYLDFSTAQHGGSIEESARHLVDIRVSQLNGCAFCLDMHVKEAKIDGERELRLHHLAIWRESPLFTPRERAILEWAELLTKLPPEGVSDEAFAAVRAHLSDKEISDLTFIVLTVNGWNRLSIAFRPVPGSNDKMFGLDKAGLA